MSLIVNTAAPESKYLTAPVDSSTQSGLIDSHVNAIVYTPRSLITQLMPPCQQPVHLNISVHMQCSSLSLSKSSRLLSIGLKKPSCLLTAKTSFNLNH